MAKTFNPDKIRDLIENISKFGVVDLGSKTRIGDPTIRAAMQGILPGDKTRKKLAAFFKVSEKKLFPNIKE